MSGARVTTKPPLNSVMPLAGIRPGCSEIRFLSLRRGSRLGKRLHVDGPRSARGDVGVWRSTSGREDDEADANMEQPLVGLVNEAKHKKEAYKEIARIHNLIPSCLLVLLGAWASGRSFAGFENWTLWVMSLVSGGVALASVIINDYFDFISGVDKINSPTKPLPSGLIQPDIALLVTLILYVSVLVAGCVMEPPLLRKIIAASVASTLFYTPLLKGVTLVKNMVVAFVIAAAPASGALGVGMGMEGVRRIAPLCTFIFCAIMAREIVMDINDTEGDGNSGINTVPVRFGKKTALILAAITWTAGMGYGMTHLWNVSAIHFGSAVGDGLAKAVVVGMFLISQPVYWGMFRCLTSGFDRDIVSGVVRDAMVAVGNSLLVLTVLG